MNAIIPIFSMLSINLYFTLSSLIGYTYKGSEVSKSYIIYCLLVAVLSISICLKKFISKGKINRKNLFVLMIPMLVSGIFLLTVLITGNISTQKMEFFKYFLLWGVPAIYMAVYVSENLILHDIIKFMEVVMIIFTLSIIFTTIIPFIRGARFESIGGATYQSASYISAFAYGINLYFIFDKNYNSRFKFSTYKLYKLVSIFLLILQITGIFLSGGRGGIILCLIYTIYISIYIFKDRKYKNIIRYIFIVLFILTIISIVYPILMKNDIFYKGVNRVFAFISSEGISWENTSGRNIVYENAIDLIMKRPILGYGLYGFLDVYKGYPHNIILEVLLNGGITYLFIVLIIAIILSRKLKKLISQNKCNRMITIILIYTLTMLMFSGSYMRTSEFWFILTIIFTYPIESKVGTNNNKYLRRN